MKTTITERGQVSIPAALRRDMHLQAGQTVVWEQLSATECRLLIEKPPNPTPDPFAAIGFAQRHGLPGGTTEQWLQVLRDGEKD